MQICGLQKVTLLDYPGKIACTLFTHGCNFRCPFCHNPSLVVTQADTIIGEETLFSFLKQRVGILEGVVISGGEPLLHAQLLPLLQKIKALGYCVKLDTNGSQPQFLKELVQRRLVDRVAMDIKNAPEHYAQTVGVSPDMTAICESKEFLMTSGVEYEFRTTLVKGLHTQQDILDTAKWIRGAKEYYLQQFRRQDKLIAGEGLSSFTVAEMQHFAGMIKEYVPAVQLRGTE